MAVVNHGIQGRPPKRHSSAFGRTGMRAATIVSTIACSALALHAQPTDSTNATITAVPGIKVGHITMQGRPTGCTVILTEAGAVGGVDVRGAAPGTRETDLLDPINSVEKVHAIVLAGGSAFGLDAASGVMRFLDISDTPAMA